MAKGSANPFPFITMVEESSPSNPSSGRQLLFIASADGLLKLRDSGGVEHTFGEVSDADPEPLGEVGPGTSDDVARIDHVHPTTGLPVEIGVACSDESTAIDATGTKVTFRMPHAMTVTEVRASLTGATSTGTVTVDINDGGTTILSTKLTIDATEKTSTTAATAAVISDSALADDAEVTVDVDDVADSTATGLKVWLIGTRA